MIHITNTDGQRKVALVNITNIIFGGSLKIVAAIFSDSNYFIKISDQNTNGSLFAEIIIELIKFIKSKKYYSSKRFWWMLDNVSFHKSKDVKSLLKENFQGVCFIPQILLSSQQ